MRIKQFKNGSTKFSFDKPNEGTIFMAAMAEGYLDYKAAANMYRLAGKLEDAERCEKLIK